MEISFGQFIRKYRKSCGLSQRKFAELLGVSFTYISKIENDVEQPPSEEIILKMANIFGFEKFPAYQLVLKSGKIPSDFKGFLLRDEESARILFSRMVSVG